MAYDNVEDLFDGEFDDGTGGFGVIDPRVMLDMDLTYEEKAVLAHHITHQRYFAYSFPPESQVAKELGISKPKYRELMESIEEKGFIQLCKTNPDRGKYIQTNPKRITQEKITYNFGSFRVATYPDYGPLMAHKPMAIPNLSIAAKAMYALINSLAVETSHVISDYKLYRYFLHFSKNRFEKCTQELIDNNYLLRGEGADGTPIFIIQHGEKPAPSA